MVSVRSLARAGYSQRNCDSSAYQKVKEIMESSLGLAMALNQVLCVLQSKPTTAQIFGKYEKKIEPLVSTNTRKNSRVLSRGLTAKYLTVQELIEARKSRERNPVCRSSKRAKMSSSNDASTSMLGVNGTAADSGNTVQRLGEKKDCAKSDGAVCAKDGGFSENEAHAVIAFRQLSSEGPN
ncbi:hypothetical protein FGB62_132g010 [Gracilaria domingensis]|nr:hypothetical protein FGB62_132g010 [Gracilaria domingensis]